MIVTALQNKVPDEFNSLTSASSCQDIASAVTNSNLKYKNCSLITSGTSIQHKGILALCIEAVKNGTVIYKINDAQYTLNITAGSSYSYVFDVNVGDTLTLVSATTDSLSAFAGILLWN